MTEDTRYYLWKAVLARNPKIELSLKEYEGIIQAKKNIVQAIYFEESWDVLVQNFIEFESELLQAALESMIVEPTEGRVFSEIRLKFARKFSNFLSSCRSYIDHAPHHLRLIEGGAAIDVFRNATSEAYDNEFAYRFLEAMRNYAQHRGLPLHGTSYDTSWVGDRTKLQDDENAKLRHSVSASIDLSKVMRDRNFKPSVAAEMPEGRSAIEVPEMTRRYVEALALVHDHTRRAFSVGVADDIKLLRDAIDRYGKVNSGDVLGLAVTSFNGDKIVESEDIFEDFISWYEHLKARNGNLRNLRNYYVSNEVLEKKKF